MIKMNEEEIKEYLQRVEELELKLVGEDRDTLQWLIFGYNECARLLNEKELQNNQLKAIEKEHQKINGELREENKKLKEIMQKAKEKSIHLQNRYDYILDDLTFLLDKGVLNELAEVNNE